MPPQARIIPTAEGGIRRQAMRIFLLAITITIAAGAFAIGTTPVRAAGATDRYPYCALDGVTGATVCYFSTREQCGPRCISNPGYVGPQGASARRATNRRAPRS
jgi:hypothetical protein